VPDQALKSLSERPPVLRIQGDQMWDALASPVRNEMLTHMEAMGGVTVAELAEAMDRAPDGLYHHMRVLEGAGVVYELGKQPSRRRPESVYAVAGRRVNLDRGLDEAKGFMRVMRTMLATVTRRANESLRANVREVVFRVETAWLTDEEARRVRAHMKQVLRIVHASRRRERIGRRHTVVVAGFPTENKHRTFPETSRRSRK